MTEAEKTAVVEGLRGLLRYTDADVRIPADAAIALIQAQEKALQAINEVRNSIVGMQKVGWSLHVYPLVAALEEAGLKGEGYKIAHEKAISINKIVAELEATIAERDAEIKYLKSQHARTLTALMTKDVLLTTPPQEPEKG